MKTNNKLREALVKICNEIRSYCDDYGAGESHKSLVDRTVNDPPDYTCYRDTILKIDSIVEAALAEPVRNCDVGTAEEQWKCFDEFCDAWQESAPVEMCSCECPVYKMKNIGCDGNQGRSGCYAQWAQMPYEE